MVLGRFGSLCGEPDATTATHAGHLGTAGVALVSGGRLFFLTYKALSV